MGCLGKGLVSVLILTMAVSCLTLIMTKPASAQTTPTPSVPQFTLSFHYEFASPTVQRSTGEYMASAYITVKIKNQHFTPYLNASKYLIQLYYDVRWKYYFESSWEGSLFSLGIFPTQVSSSGYTDIPVGFDVNKPLTYDDALINIPFGLKGFEDIQVEACMGYLGRNFSNPNAELGTYFAGETSGWSSTQAINISIAPQPTPTPTVHVPELSSPIIVSLLLSLFSVAVILGHRKTTNSTEKVCV